MNDNQVKVLFQAGAGRSGSTILHSILGRVNGFVSVGELRHIWERGLVDNRLCGCGVPFRSCEFWQTVMQEAYGGFDGVDGAEMAHQTESFRIHHLPSFLVPTIRAHWLSRLRSYLDNLTALYQAIQKVTGCRVLVDSSKNPAYGYLVRAIPQIDFYELHFVRDSRAVAYSWTTVKAFQPDPADPDYMSVKSVFSSAMQWNARNLTAEFLLPYKSPKHLTMRYEDFMRKPQESLTKILRMVGEEGARTPFVSPNAVDLGTPEHSVFGNLVRFQTGVVELRRDNRWRKQMKFTDKLLATAVTAPLMLRYGYLMPQPLDLPRAPAAHSA